MNGKRWTATLVLVFCVSTFFFLIPSISKADAIHVDSRADEPGDGSQSKPYRTLRIAVKDAAPGDVITVRCGSYPERLIINTELTITASGGLVIVDPFTHSQAAGSDVLAFQAEELYAITDPDSDNRVFSVEDGGLAQRWYVVTSPSNPGLSVAESHAIYRLRFAEAGTYSLYLRARGFSTSTDSLYVPTTFGTDPSVALHIGARHNFEWNTHSSLDNFVVSSAAVGKVLELRIGAREPDTELDTIAFVKAGGDSSDARLDAELGHFEAEDAKTNGIVPVSHTDASGGVRVTGFWQVGDFIDFGYVPAKDRIYIRYSLARTMGKQASVYVDGVDVATAQFATTETSWDEYATTFVYVPHGGVVRLQIDPDDYRTNLGDSSASIDRITLGEDGRQCIVNDVSTLQANLSAAKPGDSFIVTNGRHNKTLSIAVNGEPDRPITLRAQTAGEVDLGPGTSSTEHRLQISGSYVVVDGITYANATPTAEEVIVLVSGSHHNRITNVSIVGFNGAKPTDRVRWVLVAGKHNRVDHCHFSYKTTSGQQLDLRHDGTRNHNVADHNYFGPGPTGVSGEPIRIGASHDWMKEPANATVKYNLFNGPDGDSEVISNKSGGNYFFYNTFENLSNGHFTLRHGNGAWIEGNTFVSSTTGLRVYGQDHVIVNNHFQDLTTGIRLWGGQPDLDPFDSTQNKGCDAEVSPCDRACYFPPERVIVAHNSFSGVGTSIEVTEGNKCGNYNPEHEDGDEPPSEIIVANNLVTNTGQTMSQDFPGPFAIRCYTNFTTEDQPPPTLTGCGSAGWTQHDISVFPDSNDISRPGPGSAVVDAATTAAAIRADVPAGYPEFPDVELDMDGQQRSLTQPDVGADEVGTVPGFVGRLSREDVGPRWGTRLGDQ